MSLSATSDGILETQVTWEEFESHIRLALRTDARLGSNKSVVDIGEGNGFLSRCGLINCDWVGSKEEEKLPTKVVLKIPSALPLRKLNDSLPQGQRMFDGGDAMWEVMEGNLRKAHNIEVATYEFYEDFERLSIPKMYYGKPFGGEDKMDGQICIEYVDNSSIMNYHENYAPEFVRQVARAIGKLQACSLRKEPTAPELHKSLFEEIAETIPFESFDDILKGLLALDDSDKTKELVGKLEGILPEYNGTIFVATLHKQMGIRPVLVNGDLRTENVLIDNETGDLASLIDWQCTHLGVGVEDLIRIAIFSLSREDRHSSYPMLVEEMYNSLVENLNGAEPPYTLDTLLLLSDLLFPHCALFYASGCISLIMNQNKDPRMSEEEKTKRKEIQLDKLLGALADMRHLHEKNKKHTANLKFGKILFRYWTMEQWNAIVYLVFLPQFLPPFPPLLLASRGCPMILLFVLSLLSLFDSSLGVSCAEKDLSYNCDEKSKVHFTPANATCTSTLRVDTSSNNFMHDWKAVSEIVCLDEKWHWRSQNGADDLKPIGDQKVSCSAEAPPGAKTMLWVAIFGSIGGVLVLFCIIAAGCYWRIKRKAPKTEGLSVSVVSKTTEKETALGKIVLPSSKTGIAPEDKSWKWPAPASKRAIVQSDAPNDTTGPAPEIVKSPPSPPRAHSPVEKSKTIEHTTFSGKTIQDSLKGMRD